MGNLLAVMDNGKCILQVQGIRPFFGDKFDITKHPQYKQGLLRNLETHKTQAKKRKMWKNRRKGNREKREKSMHYGKLDPENDWIKLAELVPWDVAQERYAARFVNNGHPAHPCRMALGTLLIQRQLKCSGQWLVKYIGENPYLQCFIGMTEYGPCPFGAPTLLAFRKRFRDEDIAVILEMRIKT